jgi:hypothetical protein
MEAIHTIFCNYGIVNKEKIWGVKPFKKPKQKQKIKINK